MTSAILKKIYLFIFIIFGFIDSITWIWKY